MMTMRSAATIIFALLIFSCRPTGSQQTLVPGSENNTLLLFYEEVQAARYAPQFSTFQRELSRLQSELPAQVSFLTPAGHRLPAKQAENTYSMLVLIESAPEADLLRAKNLLESRAFLTIWRRTGELLLFPSQDTVAQQGQEYQLVLIEQRSSNFQRLHVSEKQALIKQENSQLRSFAAIPQFQTFFTVGTNIVRIFSSFQLSSLVEVTAGNAYYDSVTRLTNTDFHLFKRINPEELDQDSL